MTEARKLVSNMNNDLSIYQTIYYMNEVGKVVLQEKKGFACYFLSHKWSRYINFKYIINNNNISLILKTFSHKCDSKKEISSNNENDLAYVSDNLNRTNTVKVKMKSMSCR